MKTKLKISAVFSFLSIAAFGQVGINTDNPHISSILENKSETKGLLIPRLSQSERNSITNPPEGLAVYNNTSHMFEAYNGSTWGQSPFYSQDFWKIKGNEQTVNNSTNMIGTSDTRIFSIRTNNIAAMNIETNSQVKIGDRTINRARLHITKAALNSTLPAIVAQHSTGFGDAVRYPNDITLTNIGTGAIKGNLAFSDNITDAENGISRAGISYFDTNGSDTGFSFYTGGHPANSQDKTFERMKVLSNGNVGIGTSTPVSKLQIEDGDIFITDPTKGIVLNSSGTCHRITVTNSGTLTANTISCP